MLDQVVAGGAGGALQGIDRGCQGTEASAVLTDGAGDGHWYRGSRDW